MGSSILSEGCKHLDSQDGALQCYYYPLNRLPASRLLLPRSGLERSDFVLWPFCDMWIGPNVCFAPRPAALGRDSEFDNVQRTGPRNSPKRDSQFVCQADLDVLSFLVRQTHSSL